MDTGHRLGLIALYTVMGIYALLIIATLIQILFRAAIEKYRHRQWRQQRAQVDTLRVPSRKRGWANTWLPRNPETIQPEPGVKVVGSLRGVAPAARQTLVLVSIIMALGLASLAVAQPKDREVSASALKRQLIDVESKETELRLRLAELDEQLKPESIERALAGFGSVHPEELREHRRKLLTIERNGLQTQLDLLEEDRAQIAAAIAAAENASYLQSAQPSPTPALKRATEMAIGNFGAINFPTQKLLVAMAMLLGVAAGLIFLLIVGFKRPRQRHFLLLILLFPQFFLPVSAQSEQPESFKAFAKGHGSIVSTIEEREFSAVLIVLHKDGQAVITLFSDLQLQTQGTWSANASSPQEIELKITGGELSGNLSGTGKLLLSDDRTTVKELNLKGTTFDRREMTLRFIAETSESQRTAHINLVSWPGLP